jgi:uncharacterized protein YjeT (DUF2065 family)
VRRFAAIIAGLALLLRPAAARAGMPMPILTDWATARVETISFFVVLFLILTFVIWQLWNYLAREFTLLPRLTLRRALAAVLLVSMMLAVVLTMIAGARELLTPGAWQKQGHTYHLSEPPP